MQTFIGVDYGSKLAGTTAIAYLEDERLNVICSEKKKDADAFLKKNIQLIQPTTVFIDAPLSLPLAYSDIGYDDFFFRAADRTLKAMSPMFLGGLTARAMKLKRELSDFQFHEIYPSKLAQIIGLKEMGYKKEKKHIKAILAIIANDLPYPISYNLPTWHHVDAVLAYLSGWRYFNDIHESYGTPEEGIIIV